MKKLLIPFFCLLTLTACNNNEQKGDPTGDIQIDETVGNADVKTMDMAIPQSPSSINAMKAFPSPEVKPDEAVTQEQSITKKVIKDGNINFETANIDTTRKAIYRKLKNLGGYISNEQESNDAGASEKTYTISAHVPAKNFDAFLTGVAETAVKIDSKNISTRDVTSQYIDMTTRLANKKKLEQRYLDLLAKGNKIADLLEIEEKLTEIRTDIESTQGQLNYLNKQIDYSALEITFYTKQTVKESGATFGYRIKKALVSGWDGLVNLFFWIISSWHYLLLLIIAFVFIKRWRENIRKKKV